jgi:RHS repeat-associated protein
VHGAGVDEPLVWYEGAGLTDRRWLIADHQGSVIASTDAAGATTRHAYGPHGEPAAWTGPRFRYTGQIALPEAQLYHYKARVYDPLLGRFLQTDPVGYQDDLNVDPTGRESACIGFGRCAGWSGSRPDDKTIKGMSRGIALGTVGVVATATVVGVIATSEAAGGGVAAGLIRSGAPPAAAAMLGEGTAGAVAASELQTLSDVVSGEGFSPSRTAAAGAMGFFGGSLTGAIPIQAGKLVRGGLAAPVGALSAAVVGGSDTTGADLVLGAASGAGGVYSNSLSTTFDLFTGAQPQPA